MRSLHSALPRRCTACTARAEKHSLDSLEVLLTVWFVSGDYRHNYLMVSISAPISESIKIMLDGNTPTSDEISLSRSNGTDAG